MSLGTWEAVGLGDTVGPGGTRRWGWNEIKASLELKRRWVWGNGILESGSLGPWENGDVRVLRKKYKIEALVRESTCGDRRIIYALRKLLFWVWMDLHE